MITLITGTPGSGKSLRAVWMISEAVKAGRAVYTDIDGVTIPGVYPAPDDWRETPEGSLVVYDEVQRRWPSTGKPGQAPDEDIRGLETHRHTGHDIVVITQHPTLVHHHVRKLVGEHIHVRRNSGAHIVTLFTLSEVFDPKDKNELRNTDKQTWRYPKALFSQYKSATAHTHKFKLPMKLKLLGGFIAVLVFILVWYFSTHSLVPGAAVADDAEPPSGIRAAATAAAQSSPRLVVPAHLLTLKDALTQPRLPSVRGCSVSPSRGCRCFDEAGDLLALEDRACGLVASSMPRRLSRLLPSVGSDEESKELF